MELKELVKLINKKIKSSGYEAHLVDGFFYDKIEIKGEATITVKKLFSLWSIEITPGNKHSSAPSINISMPAEKATEINVLLKLISSNLDTVYNYGAQAGETDDFWVFVRAAGKYTLNFDNEKSAKEMYDKIVSSGKLKYQDVLDHSETDKGYYDKFIAEGGTPDAESGYGPDEVEDVEAVSYGSGNKVFEEKEFE